MRDLVVNAQLTLDGVMQAPGGPEEDRDGGFSQGGWSVNYWDEALGESADETFDRPFDLLLGRRTYEIFAAHWPFVTDEPLADTLTKATKYVASTTLENPSWDNTVVLQGDVAEAVARLKEQDGPELLTQGSANLIQTLLRHDLVDEFRLWVFPVVVGGGKRLFENGAPPAGLTVTQTRTTPKGVVVAVYRKAGPLETGSFALEEPTDAELARREREQR